MFRGVCVCLCMCAKFKEKKAMNLKRVMGRVQGKKICNYIIIFKNHLQTKRKKHSQEWSGELGQSETQNPQPWKSWSSIGHSHGASIPAHPHPHRGSWHFSQTCSVLFCVGGKGCLSFCQPTPSMSITLPPFPQASSPSTEGWYRRYLHILANYSAPSKALHPIGLGLHQSLGVALLTEGMTLPKVAG